MECLHQMYPCLYLHFSNMKQISDQGTSYSFFRTDNHFKIINWFFWNLPNSLLFKVSFYFFVLLYVFTNTTIK
jgi:hypothetical protein